MSDDSSLPRDPAMAPVSHQPPACDKQDLLMALVLGLGFLLVYLRTLCPTVYMGDSGEFCTAVATGGVPHPPGYPLFGLLARAALLLVPTGEPAFRIGCVVVLAAAGAVGVLYLLARELRCSPWASLAAAGLFGAGYTFWNQSTRVEVYSLHVLLVGAVLLFALRYRRTSSNRHLAAGVLAFSLGLAHHLTIVLLAPALFALCGRQLWKDPHPGRRALLIAALLPVGPALYLLLLLWARAEPLHAWGNTVTLPLLWNHASARIFRIFMIVPDMSVLLRVGGQARRLFQDNFPFLLWVLPVVGMAILWRRDRVVAGSLLLVALAVNAYNLFYEIDDIAAYYLPVWMIAAALLALSLDAIRWRAPRLLRGPVPAGLILTLLVAVPLTRNWQACDLSGATWVRDLARQKLEAAQSGCVLITYLDDDINPIWYVHDVLKVRPDVTPIERWWAGSRTWGLYQWDPSLWYLHRLRRQGVNAPVSVPADASARAALARDGYLIHLLDHQLRGRPVCLTALPNETPLSKWLLARYRPVPQGLIVRLQPWDAALDLLLLVWENERIWGAIHLPDLRTVRTDQEIAPDYITNYYGDKLMSFGGLYEASGDIAHAEAVYRRVRQWAPGYAGAIRALASLRAGTAGMPPTAPGRLLSAGS